MRCTVARARRFDAAFKETSPTGKLTNQLAGVNFYYNLQNQLVFQKGTGTSNRHSQDAYYFWLGDIPVGVFNNQGAFNIYADHLNTPRQLFAWDDQWGQPTTRAKWQWNYSPFGANQPTTDANFYREEYADELKFPVTARNTRAQNPVMDLRYPGQFYDASTGLHQNWMRMYDPQTARYTRADPIGLNGGMNRYAYVGGNALWAVDEMGLAAKNPIRPGPRGIPWGPGNGHVVDPDTGFPLPSPSWDWPSIDLSWIYKNPKPRWVKGDYEKVWAKAGCDEGDVCELLKSFARKNIKKAYKQMGAMRNDKVLFQHAREVPNPKMTGGYNTTWVGHRRDLEHHLKIIDDTISMGQKLGCDMSDEIILRNGLYVPLAPDRYLINYLRK